MSVEVTFNGTAYTLPTTNEVDWGAALNTFLAALASGASYASKTETLTNKTISAAPSVSAGTVTGDVVQAGALEVTLDDQSGVGGGSATINAPSGKVLIESGTSTFSVSNELVTASSIIILQIEGGAHDATLQRVIPEPAESGFTIHGNASATGDVVVSFVVINGF